MDGVTILNTITENISTTDSFKVIFVFSMVIIAISLIAIIEVSDGFSKFNDFVIIYIIIGILGVVLLVTSIVFIDTPPKESQTIYEVIISEEVSFKDFTSKYEIIEQHGEIYVVKERE